MTTTQLKKIPLAGLEKLSLVDFPGHLASTVFIQGCNFTCPYCQNPDLVTFDRQFDFSEGDLFAFLARREGKIEAAVITGGEPAIYSELPELAARIKDAGFLVKLDTNGSNPDQLEKLLRRRLIDYIALDIKTSFSKYNLVTDVKDAGASVSRSVYLAMLSTVPYEFRTTCAPGIVDAEDFKAIGSLVKGAKKYCLQQFRPAVTYDKKFQSVRPYPKKELQKFKNIMGAFVEKVELRGL